ncbi:MAG: NmrA family NAD(P)-binding protein [Trueperaceae bacterium]|nr:NmrA family NAD(P)-binding protein [Trueperaceae bacterium]
MFLIAGATGSLGGRVARSLLERGEHVRVLVRSASPARAAAGRHTDPPWLRAWGAETVEADLTRPETLPAALAGVTHVFSTASATKRAAPDTLAAVDVGGTAALAREAARAGVRQFVYLSAHGADADAERAISRVKGQAESAVRAAGVPFTFLRPTKFMQDWIGFLIGAQLQASTAAGRPRVQLVGDGDVQQSFVDEADVARLAVAVLGRDDTIGETIPLATEVATYRELVARVARLLGTEVAIETLPIGGTVDTVPEALAGTITGLLTLPATSPPDTLTTPEVAARFGFALTGIDGYLREALPG